MNWLEKEVPSVALCAKLEEASYPQKGELYWFLVYGVADRTKITKYIVAREEEICFIAQRCYNIFPEENGEYLKEKYVAPTCRELEEWLPQFIEYKMGGGYRDNTCLRIEKNVDNEWIIYYYDKAREFILGAKVIKGEQLIIIIAKMLIWLAESKYIDFKKEAK